MLSTAVALTDAHDKWSSSSASQWRFYQQTVFLSPSKTLLSAERWSRRRMERWPLTCVFVCALKGRAPPVCITAVKHKHTQSLWLLCTPLGRKLHLQNYGGLDVSGNVALGAIGCFREKFSLHRCMRKRSEMYQCLSAPGLFMLQQAFHLTWPSNYIILLLSDRPRQKPSE